MTRGKNSNGRKKMTNIILTTAEVELLKPLVSNHLSEITLRIIDLGEKEASYGLGRETKKFQTACMADMATARDLLTKLKEV
jgi:hypothetical protein